MDRGSLTANLAVEITDRKIKDRKMAQWRIDRSPDLDEKVRQELNHGEILGSWVGLLDKCVIFLFLIFLSVLFLFPESQRKE